MNKLQTRVESLANHSRKTQLFMGMLLWTFWGVFGGLIIGAVLLSLYGWSLFGSALWLSFGVLVGALVGAASFAIYAAHHGLLSEKHLPRSHR